MPEWSGTDIPDNEPFRLLEIQYLWSSLWRLYVAEPVHGKQGSCEGSDEAYPWIIQGKAWGYPAYDRNEGNVCLTERNRRTARKNLGFRYTQMIGKARMEMKVGLTFACMNLKKQAKLLARKGKRWEAKCLLWIKYILFAPKTRKTLLSYWPKAFCLQLEFLCTLT